MLGIGRIVRKPWLYTLAVIYLSVIAAPNAHSAEDQASPRLHPRKIFCVVKDNGRIDCQDILKIAEQEKFKKFLELYVNLEMYLDEGVLFRCGQGRVRSLKFPKLSSKVKNRAEDLKGSDLRQMRQSCEVTLDDLVATRSGNTPSGYQQTVSQTIARVENDIANCKKLGSGTLATLPAAGVVPVVKIVEGGREIEIFDHTGEIAIHIIDGQEGQEEKEGVEIRIKKKKGTPISTHGLTHINVKLNPPPAQKPEPPPKKPPKPAPPEMPPPGVPAPEVPFSGDCFEMDCARTCKELAEWWTGFKKQCDATRWETYNCKSFIAGQNANCPNPAVVTPLPDGNYYCSTWASDETIRDARTEFCKKLGGVMNPGTPDGASQRCTLIARIARPGPQLGVDICNDPRAMPRPDNLCELSVEVPGADTGQPITGGGQPRPTRR